MTRFGNSIITKLARRIFKDPTTATQADVEKLARAWLIAAEGVLPK
jgi:hypothetical protein